MDKKAIVELTNKVYRISILFPKKEPLRYKIRETADEILANYIKFLVEPSFVKAMEDKGGKDLVFVLKKDLEIIKSYLNVAKWQNWVSYFDILEIEEKYDSIDTKINIDIDKLKSEEEIVLPIKEPALDIEEKKKSSFDDRKSKIIEILTQKEKVQVWEVNEVFPDISKRTIRRDFVELLKQGLIERIGERSETFYRLKSIVS